MTRKDEAKFISSLQEISERLLDDRIFEAVMDEVARREFDTAARSRALADAEGNPDKVDALYIKHRVRRIKDMVTAERLMVQKLHSAETRQRQAISEIGMSNSEKTMYRLGRWLVKK